MEDKTMEQVILKLQRELRFTRVICTISSLLMIGILVGGVICYNYVQKVIKDVEPVMATVSELNVEELNSTLESINTSLEEVDWQQVSETIGQLDVEAINSAIEDLDTEELTKALTNLNDTTDSLKETKEKIMSFFSIFDNES